MKKELVNLLEPNWKKNRHIMRTSGRFFLSNAWLGLQFLLGFRSIFVLWISEDAREVVFSRHLVSGSSLILASFSISENTLYPVYCETSGPLYTPHYTCSLSLFSCSHYYCLINIAPKNSHDRLFIITTHSHQYWRTLYSIDYDCQL